MRRSLFGIAAAVAAAAAAAAAAATAAAAADVGGAATCRWRYFFSVISVALPGVAAERGEDPMVDGSHGREEGGDVKDDNDGEYHEGGGGVGGGTTKSSLPPPPLMPLEPSPMSALQSLPLGTTTVFTVPQRSADIAGLVFQYLLIGMYSFH